MSVGQKIFWTCDRCSNEQEHGSPTRPPEYWARITFARASDYHEDDVGDYDLCEICSREFLQQFMGK